MWRTSVSRFSLLLMSFGAWAAEGLDCETDSELVPEAGMCEMKNGERVRGTCVEQCLAGPEFDALRERLGSKMYTDSPSLRNYEVQIEIYDYAASELMSAVYRILLTEMLGYFNVTTVYRADISSGFERVAKCKHSVLEIWNYENDRKPFFNEYVINGTVDYGFLGVLGQESIFVGNQNFIASHYKALQEFPSAYDLYPTNDDIDISEMYNETDFPCGPPDEESYWPRSSCQNNRWFPPQCSPVEKNCRELWLVKPSWSGGWFESMVYNLGLNFSINYLGSAGLQEKVVEKRASGKGYGHYWWSPDSFLSLNPAVKLFVPDFSTECGLKYNEEPLESGVDCGQSVTNLIKLLDSSIAEIEPDLYHLWNSFKFTTEEQLLLMGMELRGGAVNQTTDMAACTWLKKTYGDRTVEWDKWLKVHPLICGLGHYIDTGLCKKCEPGTYSDVVDATECQVCPKGSFQDEAGQALCNMCPPGEFLIQEGSSTHCEPCPVGMYQGESGSSTCLPCPMGTSTNVEGTRACPRCTPGFYEDREGSTLCKECPKNTRNYAYQFFDTAKGETLETFLPSKLADCRPIAGYYGENGEESQKCPEGASCCICDYCAAWQEEGFIDKSECDAFLMERLSTFKEDFCVDLCASGTRLPVPLDGHLRSEKNEDEIVTCPLTGSCSGAIYQYFDSSSWWGAGSSSNASLGFSPGYCGNEYKGNLCGECIEGYYMREEECAECPEQTSGAAEVLFILLVIIIAVFMVYTIKQGVTWFKNGAVTIGCDFIQLVGVYFSFDLKWPHALASTFQLASVLNLNFELFATQCVVDGTFYSLWRASMFVPVYIVIGYTLIYIPFGLRFYFERVGEEQGWREFMYFINGVLTFLSVGYVFMVKVTLEFFHCETLEDGHAYISTAPSQECYTTEWFDNLWLGISGILFYCIGIPFGFALVLWKNRDNLMNPFFKKSFGAIYIVYKEETYLWEVIIKLKKLFILAILVFFPDELIVQVLVALIILLFMMVLSNLYSPFRFYNNNRLQFFASLVAFLILFVGLFFFSDKLTSSESDLIVGLSLVMISIMLGTLLHGFILEYCAYYGPIMMSKYPMLKKLVNSSSFAFMFGDVASKDNFGHWAAGDQLLANLVTKNLQTSERLSSDSSPVGRRSWDLPGSPKSLKKRTLSEVYSERFDMLGDKQHYALEQLSAEQMQKFEKFLLHSCPAGMEREGFFSRWIAAHRKSPEAIALSEGFQSVYNTLRLEIASGELKEHKPAPIAEDDQSAPDKQASPFLPLPDADQTITVMEA